MNDSWRETEMPLGSIYTQVKEHIYMYICIYMRPLLSLLRAALSNRWGSAMSTELGGKGKAFNYAGAMATPMSERLRL